MEDTNNILQDKIRLYDQENGTELARFVAFLERGKVYEGNENIFSMLVMLVNYCKSMD